MANPGNRHPTRGLTEGAILAALTVIVAAVGLVAPFVGILLAPLPIMLLVIRWGMRTALLATIVAGLVLLQFFGPLQALLTVATFAPLGLALGWGIRHGMRASGTVLVGAAAFLAAMLAGLGLTMTVLHQNVVDQLIQSQVKSLEMAISLQQRMGAPAQQIEDLRKTVTILPQFFRTAFPVFMALGALVWSYLCYIVARRVLRRVGHELPPVPAILTWRLHPFLGSVLLWVAAATSLVGLRDPRAGGAALDAMLVALFVFAFQGALVGITWLNQREIPRFFQVLLGVLLLGAGIYPLLGLAAIGLMDTWFDYRGIGRAPTSPPAGSRREPAEKPPARAGGPVVKPKRPIKTSGTATQMQETVGEAVQRP